jgi:hypothetical protein
MEFASRRTTTLRSQKRAEYNLVSLCWHLALVTLTAAAFFTVTLSILVRRNAPPPDPFAEFADIFPGHRSEAVFARGFTCYRQPSFSEFRCSRSFATGAFYRVSVTVSNSVVTQIQFSVRAHALTVGDMLSAWGRPLVHYDQSTNLQWPDKRVSALAWLPDGRLDYFAPLLHIFFTEID